MNVLEAISKKRIYFDGGMGTVLQQKGLKSGEKPELWNLTRPEDVTQIHKDYLCAGANIITTNTFGVNKDKFQNYAEIIKAGIDCAKRACKEFEDAFVAFDMGPTGRLLKPLGDLDFESAVELFANNVRVAQQCGADLILIETRNDSYETKAAVLAAKENCNLPIFVTNVYDESQKLMTGASPKAMITLLESLGVDAIGVNCSLGPDKMIDVVREYNKYSSLPIIVNPNAGLPKVVDGKTVFTTSAKEFSDYMVEIAKSGATVLGGCCGTTPEYIQKTVQKTNSLEYTLPTKKSFTAVSSYTHAVEIGKKPILIGERINPTGKKRLKEALKSDDMNYILGEAVSQESAGVHILDVNVGLPEIDEPKWMQDAVYQIQSVTDLPLQIDTSDVKALEKGLRIYNGKPLINSVNGKKESMDAVFPLVKKYGGTVIALTLDENGIPETTQERVDIAKRIIETAKEYGIDKKDIIVDPLAMTISADTKNAVVTLECIKELRELGIYTSLGVSNISFGLPARNVINSVFFATALQNGLNLAIMNPFSKDMMNTYFSFCAIANLDPSCKDFIEYATATENESEKPSQETNIDLVGAIVKGVVDLAVEKTNELLETKKPLEIINDYIIPALNKIGNDFEQKKAYLPQLLMSAEAASKSFEELKKKLDVTEVNTDKKVVLATVKGDVHDIGKNIVKVLLESYGFEVIDLGKDVDPEKVVECAKENNCKLVGLSALMTTTVASMEETIKLLKQADSTITVVVGGAVLTEEYSKMINADAYCPDAMAMVRFAESFYS